MNETTEHDEPQVSAPGPLELAERNLAAFARQATVRLADLRAQRAEINSEIRQLVEESARLQRALRALTKEAGG